MIYPVEINPDVFAIISRLLATGKYEKDGKSIDLSPVQTIRIDDGVLVFNPPAKISAKFGPFKINTTLSSLTLNEAGEQTIRIEVDNSHIDLELRPE